MHAWRVMILTHGPVKIANSDESQPLLLVEDLKVFIIIIGDQTDWTNIVIYVN